MSNFKQDLIYPFYSGLSTDLLTLHESLFSRERLDCVLEEILADPVSYVRSMLDFGKAFEKSLINTELRLMTNSKYADPLFSFIPNGFRNAYHIFFNEDGYALPYGDTLCRLAMAKDYSLIEASDELPRLVRSIRQWTLAFSKVEDIEPSVDETALLENFKARIVSTREHTLENEVVQYARMFLADIFSPEGRLAPQLAQWASEPFGRHGPGAVEDGSSGSGKWMFRHIDGLDERIYRLHIDIPDDERHLDDIEIDTVPYSRVCVVPKDLANRRIICIEPKELMFAQQGLMQIVYDLVHQHPLAKRLIDFRHQERSQDMARDLFLATIDLKDASDLVSKTLAKKLLPREVYRLVTLYRSRGIQFPDGSIVEDYETLFTMGNALCFPFESLIFLALCVGTRCYWDPSVRMLLLKWCDHSYTRPDHLAQRLRCRVFGDDIIVPNYLAQEVVHVLHSAGLVINENKTCVATPVRESCGAWFYAMADARVAKLTYSELTTLLTWISVSESCKFMTLLGFPEAGRSLASCLSDLYPVPFGNFGFPDWINRSGEEEAIIMGLSRDLYKQVIRFNRVGPQGSMLQRLEMLLPCAKNAPARKSLPGNCGLYAWFTGQATLAVENGNAQCVEFSWFALDRPIGIQISDVR